MFKLTLWNYTCVMSGPTSPLFSLLCVVGSCMCAVNDAKCSLMRTADAKRFEDDRGDSVALWLFIKSYWLWTAVWTQTAQASKTEWNQRGGGGGGVMTETWKMKRVSSEQNRESQPPVHEQLFVFVSVVSSAHGLFLITDAISAL